MHFAYPARGEDYLMMQCALTTTLTVAATMFGASAREEASSTRAELRTLQGRIPAFQIIPLSVSPGDLVLMPEQSLTVEDLRGVDLDDDPPVLGRPATPFDKRMTDDFQPGEAAYVAKNIKPFRFRYFNCEFNYGGWHNFAMTDYASAHGFNILSPYVRRIEDGAHLPEGTQWLAWGGFINWHHWTREHGIPDGRWDMLTEFDLVKLHLQADKFKRVAQPQKLSDIGDYLMIDMEHGVVAPERLREQDWYPRDGENAEKSEFEKRYYDGYAETYLSAVETARKQGWKNISLYGWQPAGRIWGGLDKRDAHPDTYHPWIAFGRRIYGAVDLINNSVYCFYWSPQNVAYVLANIDDNMRLVNSMPVKKPVRPYFWTLLHGGGAGWRWWKGQPLPCEEIRAMIAMALFTGIDGFDTWNWSGTGNHHTTPALAAGQERKAGGDYFSSGADVMLKNSFDLQAEGAATDDQPYRFRRYDVVHVIGLDEQRDLVRFQKIKPTAKDRGLGDAHLTYAMPIKQLSAHLRVKSEPVAAMIEGMALARPFETLLRHGEIKIDVSAHRQFAETLPVVRRVKLDGIHVLITYDPAVIHGREPRRVVLQDFDGHEGLTLTLPADDFGGPCS